jgi:YggT family protein
MAGVVLKQLTIGVAWTLDWLLTMYWWIVLISVLLTWVNPDPYNSIVRFLRGVTEPVFYRIRRLFPFVVVQGFDLSPIVVIVGIEFARIVIVRSLYQLAIRLAAAGVVAVG